MKSADGTTFDLQRSRSEKAVLLAVVFIIGVLAIIAYVSPPNDWDSMTYHMGRVMHWLQNGSVVHYPTHIMRQLGYPPWGEFAIMHLQALAGSDRFAPLVQWVGMLGCLIGVSLIVQEFGYDTKRQLFAAVIVATIPAGILQSTSTKNNYMVSFWLVCFVFYLF